MNKGSFTTLLLGKDLRTLGQNNVVVQTVHDQCTFDELSSFTSTMRDHLLYLAPRKSQLLTVLKSADHKELKWHIAQLLPRVDLTAAELKDVWHTLAYWALSKNENKIVGVNALQGLFDLLKIDRGLKPDFEKIISALEHAMIPSIQARIRKLKRTKN